MLATRILAAVTAVLLLSLAPTTAAVAGGKKEEKRIQDQLDECLGDELYPYGPPSCTFDAEGNLIDRDVPGESDPGSGFGGFLLLALLWSLLPMVIAGSIASSRGQSVGLAILATLFLGWLGLFLVLVLQRQEVVDTAKEVVDRAGRRDVVDEIRRLGRLRDDGLLTDDEFQAKKRQLLETS